MNGTILNSTSLVIPKPLWELPTLTAIEVGTFSISTYPLMIAVGALGMLACILVRRKKYHFAVWQCVIFTILLTLCGIAGAKLLYILENIPDYLNGTISGSGVSFFGSVFLIPVVMPLIGRTFGLRRSETNDLCAPCIAVMVGFIRIGCLLCGCCGGRVAYVGNYYFTWPTQIIESVGDFVIFFWLLHMERGGKWEKLLYPLFLLSYSILRFIVEFLRYSSNTWLNISNGHWFAAVAILSAILWIIMSRRKNTILTKRVIT